jgi:hypothetical protein
MGGAAHPAREPMRQAEYSSQVQQRPLTAASQHSRQHTELAGTTSKRPAAPLVRDEEAVPVACPIGRSTPGTHGHSLNRSERTACVS